MNSLGKRPDRKAKLRKYPLHGTQHNIGRYFEWPSEELFESLKVKQPLSTIRVTVEDHSIAGI